MKKPLTLERISESLLGDSTIEKLNKGETLTLNELFSLQKWITNKIQDFVTQPNPEASIITPKGIVSIK